VTQINFCSPHQLADTHTHRLGVPKCFFQKNRFEKSVPPRSDLFSKIGDYSEEILKFEHQALNTL
jgi:hypothetical protein